MVESSNEYDKKLCCRKEAARCFMSVQLQYKTSSAVFYYQLFRLQITLRTIKFFSVIFYSAYSSMLQAVTNKNSLVRRRLCDLHAWSSVTVFGTSHVQQSSIASYQTRIAICAYTPPAFDAPVRGGVHRNIATPFGTEKLEWCGYPMVKKFRRYVYSFCHDPRT